MVAQDSSVVKAVDVIADQLVIFEEYIVKFGYYNPHKKPAKNNRCSLGNPVIPVQQLMKDDVAL